jgi:hypothetical protein
VSWGLDAVYLRHPDEFHYCARLQELRVDRSRTCISPDLVCFDFPWVPYVWPPPQHFVEVDRARFPGTGDLADPSGSDICLDSAWRLRLTSIEGGVGDPGRLLAEIKREYRDARKYGFLVPYQQVEFYEQSPATRHAYYVREPPGWAHDAWTSQHMFVPLPPCVTYRASHLLHTATADSPFWWLVFESEWVVLYFGRWCSDIAFRHLMWRMPLRAQEGLTRMGVRRMLQGSRFSEAEVNGWLTDHDTFDWDAETMPYKIRGHTPTAPAEYETYSLYVRTYDPSATRVLTTYPPIPLSSASPVPSGIKMPVTPEAISSAAGSDASEEILASGCVPERRAMAGPRPVPRMGLRRESSAARTRPVPKLAPNVTPIVTSGPETDKTTESNPSTPIAPGTPFSPEGVAARADRLLSEFFVTTFRVAGKLPLLESAARDYSRTGNPEESQSSSPITEGVLAQLVIRQDALLQETQKALAHAHEELASAKREREAMNRCLALTEKLASTCLDRVVSNETPTVTADEDEEAPTPPTRRRRLR